MGLVTIVKCDEPSCGNTIASNSTTRIEVTGSEYTIKVYSNGSSSNKYSRLDFCNKNCWKKFIDNK